MAERLTELESCRQTVILELGLIALAQGKDFTFEYENKLEELRTITKEQITIKENGNE